MAIFLSQVSFPGCLLKKIIISSSWQNLASGSFDFRTPLRPGLAALLYAGVTTRGWVGRHIRGGAYGGWYWTQLVLVEIGAHFFPWDWWRRMIRMTYISLVIIWFFIRCQIIQISHDLTDVAASPCINGFRIGDYSIPISGQFIRRPSLVHGMLTTSTD